MSKLKPALLVFFIFSILWRRDCTLDVRIFFVWIPFFFVWIACCDILVGYLSKSWAHFCITRYWHVCFNRSQRRLAFWLPIGRCNVDGFVLYPSNMMLCFALVAVLNIWICFEYLFSLIVIWYCCCSFIKCRLLCCLR